MTRQLHRRDFLKTSGILGAGIGLAGCGGSRLFGADVAKGAPNAEKLGWRLGCTTYIFGDQTFFSAAVDQIASLGMHYLEAGRQPFSETIKTPVCPDLTPAERKDVSKKISDSGLKLVTAPYWVEYPHDRRYFDFAKEMGIETLVGEPVVDAYEKLDQLCVEYDVNYAVHDHPKPSFYWDPATVLKYCEGRSKHLGACADTGHWMRSELKPVDCVKKLEGRILYFHLKDLNEYKTGHDVPWGTGAGDIPAVLAEVKRQKLQVPFIIEYEYNVGNLMPELAQCVANFDRMAAEIAAKG